MEHLCRSQQGQPLEVMQANARYKVMQGTRLCKVVTVLQGTRMCKVVHSDARCKVQGSARYKVVHGSARYKVSTQ